MISFIDEHRGEYGVEPICRVLPIAASTYHERAAQRRDPSRLSLSVQGDEAAGLEEGESDHGHQCVSAQPCCARSQESVSWVNEMVESRNHNSPRPDWRSTSLNK